MSAMLLVAMVTCALVAPLHGTENTAKTATVNARHTDVSKKPHVFVFLVDDMGFNDISWNNKEQLSPRLQELADTGTILDFNYVQAACSPSRGSLMFGKYAVNIGMQHEVLDFQTPECADRNDTMLPAKLKDEAGYKTYMVGKWHLGFCNEACLPTHRGFDEFYGFYLPLIYYYSHTMGWPGNVGYDLHDGDEPATDNTTYATELFTERAIEMIENHDSKDPMFMYFAHAAPHAPLEVPKPYLDMYPDFEGPVYRKIIKAMVTSADESIGKVVDAIKAAGMYENSIIIFSSDNGGQAPLGSNYPLRGAKLSIYEGGTRVPAMFHSPLQTVTNNTAKGMFHISDWHATILSLAGIQPEGLDGVDQTEMLFHGGASARDEIVYNVDNIYPQYYGAAGIRVGDYKLLKGYPGLYDGWEQDGDGVGITHTLDHITGSRSKRSSIYDMNPFSQDYNAIDKYIKDIADVYQLYNLAVDPEERDNLANNASMKVIIDELQARLDVFSANAHEVDLTIQDEVPEGSPNNFDGIWSTGWC